MLSLPVTSKKLKITAYGKDGKPDSNFEPFELMLNPESYSIKSTINYVQEEKANGNSTGEPCKYTGHAQRELVLAPFILDVTGAIPFTQANIFDNSIPKMIERLEKVVYNYDGTNHEPHILQLEWGSSLHWAKLKSMDVKYTLFAENGDPLRAEVSLTMMKYKDIKEILAEQKKSSPDLTHLVEVKDGDTLPLMCNRVYKDCSYYREVAEVNGLDDFCHLTPGTFLYFPPLVD